MYVLLYWGLISLCAESQSTKAEIHCVLQSWQGNYRQLLDTGKEMQIQDQLGMAKLVDCFRGLTVSVK